MLDQATLKKLNEKYGKIGEWEDPEGRTVAVKKPTSAAYRAFIARVAKDGSDKEAAIRDLVRECVVFPMKEDGAPDTDRADAIFEDYPAGPLELSGAVTKLAGGTGDGARIRGN